MKTVISLNTFTSAEGQDYRINNTSGEVTSAQLGAFIREARLQRGLTQDELAEKCGTNKAYISKVENNLKDVRFSTLQKMVEMGLGGQLNLTITL